MKLLTGKIRSENIIIALEVIYFYLIARCFFQHTEYAGYLELALILGMFVTSICLRNAERDVKLQLFWLNFIFFSLWTAGILCKESYKGNRILIISGEFCFFAGVLILGIFLIHTTEWKNVGNYKAVALICIIFAVLSIETLDEIPMYDSGAYYSWSISKLASHFDFTCRNIFDYCLASHISVGYGMFTLLGELIIFRGGVRRPPCKYFTGHMLHSRLFQVAGTAFSKSEQSRNHISNRSICFCPKYAGYGWNY